MGISSSSLLDESKSNFVRGQANAELRDFSPHYKRQYLVAFFSKVQDQVEQKKTGQTQLLKQREPPKPGTVLYEENVLFFDDARKWREQLIVVRANYSLECHDNYETFMKGVQPRHKLLPTGGTVLTSEDKYMVLVDKLCPDLNSEYCWSECNLSHCREMDSKSLLLLLKWHYQDTGQEKNPSETEEENFPGSFRMWNSSIVSLLSTCIVHIEFVGRWMDTQLHGAGR